MSQVSYENNSTKICTNLFVCICVFLLFVFFSCNDTSFMCLKVNTRIKINMRFHILIFQKCYSRYFALINSSFIDIHSIIIQQRSHKTLAQASRMSVCLSVCQSVATLALVPNDGLLVPLITVPLWPNQTCLESEPDLG